MGIIDILLIECIGEIVLLFTPYQHRFLLRGTCKRLRPDRSIKKIVEDSYLYFVETKRLRLSLREGMRISTVVGYVPSYTFHRWFKENINFFVSHVSRALKLKLSKNDFDQGVISCHVHFFTLTYRIDPQLTLGNRTRYGGYNDIQYEYRIKLNVDTCVLGSSINREETIRLDKEIHSEKKELDGFFNEHPNHIEFPELIIAS